MISIFGAKPQKNLYARFAACGCTIDLDLVPLACGGNLRAGRRDGFSTTEEVIP
jgi:hypothetical protein